MELLMWLLISVAAAGLVASGCVNILSLLRLAGPLSRASMILGRGVFVIWLPAVLISGKLAKDYKQQDFWRAALRGCPRWMKYLVSGLSYYAFLTFVIKILEQFGVRLPAIPDEFFFTAFWMVFYSAALAISYSYSQVRTSDPERRCVNGHVVPPPAKFCPECGQPIVNQPKL